jgi:anaerobic selenocysteine-containing dehydrogenase
VIAEVQNGVWVGQEPAWDSPINRGSHCAKGASVRELVHGDRRLKYPMKLVNGEWQKISWDQAINEIGDKMLEIRAKSGADSSICWVPRNSPTKAVTCSANSRRSGAPTRSTTRPHLPLHHRRRRSTPGATER